MIQKGKTFIISGPSGVGKSTVLKALLEQRKNLYFSVSATTRAPRANEKNGVHYYKLSNDIYERLDELLEKTHSPYACYADNPKFSQLECPAIPNPKVTV